jgi:hypothetical protein
MANVVIDIAAEYTGNKAFKQAETATQKLEKSVAKLGKQLAGVFAASKLYAFGKQSVKAFAADEKAARSLALALANTGNAFAAIEVEKFIGDLQRATGVLDDNLRPAFRTLLTATGDVKKSQDALALALDISAGTGRDLGQVSVALARGFTGQTTALSRLGAGLDKATLKTGDMDVIVGQLTEKFRGQALAAAEGYSGAIAKLAVASANAKEIIGKDLLDAMQMVAGKDGIGGATTAMESFATQIGNAIYGIGVLTKAIKSLPGAGFIGDVLSAGTQISGLGLLSRLGARSKAASAGTPAQSPGQRKAIDKANADALKLQKSKNSLQTIDNNLTTRKIVLTADQQALEELKKKFDVERIGLYAALNSATDEETRLGPLHIPPRWDPAIVTFPVALRVESWYFIAYAGLLFLPWRRIESPKVWRWLFSLLCVASVVFAMAMICEVMAKNYIAQNAGLKAKIPVFQAVLLFLSLGQIPIELFSRKPELLD